MGSAWIWIILGTATVGLVVGTQWRPVSLQSLLKQAQRSGDLAPLVAFIELREDTERPTLWDQAIGQLWRRYERELATLLIVEAGMRCDADIVQYWIRQAMEVEPEIAVATFTPEFLSTCFDTQVAARVGRCGSCGCG